MWKSVMEVGRIRGSVQGGRLAIELVFILWSVNLMAAEWVGEQ